MGISGHRGVSRAPRRSRKILSQMLPLVPFCSGSTGSSTGPENLHDLTRTQGHVCRVQTKSHIRRPERGERGNNIETDLTIQWTRGSRTPRGALAVSAPSKRDMTEQGNGPWPPESPGGSACHINGSVVLLMSWNTQ